jgi:putative transposase
VDHVQGNLGISERRACQGVGQARSTQRRKHKIRNDEAALTESVIRLATKYGRYGYRRIRAMLKAEGWHVSYKRVYRIWRREGLKVPSKQPKRGRLWLNDGSCVRLRPEYPGHVWSYDFVQDRTHDGRAFRMLTVIDEFTRESLAIEVERRLRSDDVLHCLTRLFAERGPPDHIRSDNGAEFTAHAVRDWLGGMGVKTLFITPGSPWENGYVLAEPSFAWTRALMASSEMSCLTVRSSPHYAKPRFSLSAGETITMPSGRTRLSAIAHRLQKRSCRQPLS